LFGHAASAAAKCAKPCSMGLDNRATSSSQEFPRSSSRLALPMLGGKHKEITTQYHGAADHHDSFHAWNPSRAHLAADPECLARPARQAHAPFIGGRYAMKSARRSRCAAQGPERLRSKPCGTFPIGRRKAYAHLNSPQLTSADHEDMGKSHSACRDAAKRRTSSRAGRSGSPPIG
jgi:hypothetical protein